MTTPAETWRVECADGVVHTYVVEAYGRAWVATTRIGVEVGGTTPRRAVLNAVVHDALGVVAILAPGELPRAAAISAARADALREARAACERVAAWARDGSTRTVVRACIVHIDALIGGAS